jgi:hypothetical protein
MKHRCIFCGYEWNPECDCITGQDPVEIAANCALHGGTSEQYLEYKKLRPSLSN